MAARLLYARPEPQAEVIRAGLAMSAGQTFGQLAHLANFIRGKGACLVPGLMINRTISSGSTEVYRYRVKTRTSAAQRCVCIWARAASASGRPVLTVQSPSGGVSQSFLMSTIREVATPYLYFHDLAAASGAEQEISVSLAAAGGGAIIESIKVYEQDRPELAKDTTDLGVDAETELVRQPIRYVAHESWRGLVQAIGGLDWRRVGLFHLSVPDTAPLTRTSAAYQALTGLPIPILARKVDVGDVTGTVKWSVYAKMSSAGTGNVRVTPSSSGTPDVMPVTSTTFAWTTPRTFDVDCTDQSLDDGLQGSAWDELTFEFASDGVRTLSLATISVWDDDDVAI